MVGASRSIRGEVGLERRGQGLENDDLARAFQPLEDDDRAATAGDLERAIDEALSAYG